MRAAVSTFLAELDADLANQLRREALAAFERDARVTAIREAVAAGRVAEVRLNRTDLAEIHVLAAAASPTPLRGPEDASPFYLFGVPLVPDHSVRMGEPVVVRV